MHITTYELKASAVEIETGPRFFLVVLSFFQKEAKLTQVLLDKWFASVSEIGEVCGADEKLKNNVIKAVDKLTRKFASEAFFYIDNIQSIQRSVLKLGMKPYDVKGVISSFIDKFINEVNVCIDDVVEADLDIRRKMRNMQLSSERKVSSDEDEDED
jgi:hypothetical protein